MSPEKRVDARERKDGDIIAPVNAASNSWGLLEAGNRVRAPRSGRLRSRPSRRHFTGSRELATSRSTDVMRSRKPSGGSKRTIVVAGMNPEVTSRRTSRAPSAVRKSPITRDFSLEFAKTNLESRPWRAHAPARYAVARRLSTDAEEITPAVPVPPCMKRCAFSDPRALRRWTPADTSTTVSLDIR